MNAPFSSDSGPTAFSFAVIGKVLSATSSGNVSFPCPSYFAICTTKNKDLSIHSIYQDLSNEDRKGYLKILDFLIQNDYGILVDDAKTLPPLSMEFEMPFHLTNAIICTDNSDSELLFNAIRNLVDFRITALQINDIGVMSLNTLETINELTISSSIECIHIKTHFSSFYELDDFRLSNRFRSIHFFKAPKDKLQEQVNNSYPDIRYFVKDIDFLNCGNVGKKYFVNNLPFFTEAQCHNTCLNRKVCIDAEGNIKNCPAMSKSYGNIKDTTLEEAINKPGFKDLWFVNKDKIDVCKDCEFRYMCTDCRAFIKDPGNIYSQPAKCTYNPYICLWEGQEGYVPVEECGTYSRETGFVPDKKKIAMLNRKIWGED